MRLIAAAALVLAASGCSSMETHRLACGGVTPMNGAPVTKPGMVSLVGAMAGSRAIEACAQRRAAEESDRIGQAIVGGLAVALAGAAAGAATGAALRQDYVAPVTCYTTGPYAYRTTTCY
jgi:hypothetical protein